MADPAEPPGGAGGEAVGREPLSEEEIRGLLGEDGPLGGLGSGSGGGEPAEEAGEADRRGVLVLLVSRDDDESRLVRSALGGLGVLVDWVRNPFAALDQLRRRHYAAVVSNFEMWADQGALLFQRLGQRGSRTKVIFLCPGAESASRARAAGADEALRRPLDAAGLERILRLLGRLEDPAAGSRVEFLMEADPRPDPGIGAEKPAAPSRSADLDPPDEVAWLRFFFEARKAMRSHEPGRPRLEAILEVLETELGATAGIAAAGQGGWWIRVRPGSSEILWHLAIGRRSTSGGAWAAFPRPSPRSSPIRRAGRPRDRLRPAYPGATGGFRGRFRKSSSRSSPRSSSRPGRPPKYPIP